MNPANANEWIWLPVAKDMIELLFYLATGIAVIIGLWSWKKELKGRTRYEAAKNVIAGAYRVRDAINNARAPLMVPAEWENREQVTFESEKEQQARNSFYGYTKRYERVVEALSQWYPAVVEAEALFQDQARKILESLYHSAQKLKTAIEIVHQDLLNPMKCNDMESYQKSLQQFRNIVFGFHSGLAKEKGNSVDLYDDDGFQDK